MSSMAEIVRTTNFAAIKHKNQRRKDPEKTPYINHPIGVANNLIEAGCEDLAVIQAALLHDTVEDTDTTIQEVRQQFGDEVANIVAEVTDDKNLEKAERKRMQIIHAKTASKQAKLVKLSDKLYNIRDLERSLPQKWTEERRQQYFIWAAKVVKNCRGTNQVLEDKVDEVLKRNGIPDPKSVVLEANEVHE